MDAPPLDEATRNRLLEAGRVAFLRGDFYDAHEEWEQVWDQADDPERRYLQGMIQIATGLHKLARKQSAVCERLLTKALGKLEGAPKALHGMDLATMRADALAARDAIRRGELPDPASVRLLKT
jgi:predicted metal-dependent hydrolase